MRTLSLMLFVTWVALPLLLWLQRLLRRRRTHGFKLFLMSVAIGYCLILASAKATDVAMTQRMLSFDLNGDGSISGAEATPAAQAAMDDWARDTGRTMAFITGVPLSIIWSTLCLVPLCLGQRLASWMVARNKKLPANGEQREAAVTPPPDSGNPYRPPMDSAD